MADGRPDPRDRLVLLLRRPLPRSDRPRGGIGWAQSYRITLASLAATRLLAAGGIGGIALTAWALRRDGLSASLVALRMATMLVLLYAVYMGAVVLTGPWPADRHSLRPEPGRLHVDPSDCGGADHRRRAPDRLLRRRASRETTKRLHDPSRRERWRAALATVPNTLAGGVSGAIAILRERPANGVWAVGWWGFDIAVLWACLHAFGTPPPVGVIVASYFVGMTANLLPLPGGDRRRGGRHDRLADRLQRAGRPGDRRRPLLPRLLLLAADDPRRDRLHQHPPAGAGRQAPRAPAPSERPRRRPARRRSWPSPARTPRRRACSRRGALRAW